MMTREVASVLVRSAVSASERKHLQTTPLHVAATLFAAPSGLLRRFCLISLPDSSGPDCCRALEHCFSIALNNLPSDDGQAPTPLMSNALMVAIERAQASQRRRCPEHPQQLAAPLRAVRVEIEQLVVSILDDPQVSYVMREAGFLSATIKALVEQSLFSYPSTSFPITTVPVLTMNPSSVSPVPSFPARLSVNPRPLNVSGAAGTGGGEQQPTEEVKRVMSTLSRFKKRNPIVVGDFDPQAVTKAVIQTIESGLAPSPVRTARVISFAKELATAATTGDKSWIAAKAREMGDSMLCHDMTTTVGVVVDIGDIKYLVESPVRPPTTTSSRINSQQPVSETACAAAVAYMARFVKTFREAGFHVWLLGTATYSTYLRCQIYHPTMDDDWDLQPLQVAQSCQILPRMDLVKKLSKGLRDKVRWQREAASGTAGRLLLHKTDNRRGHTWLLYIGPDKIGKRKMATALSELVFRTPPVVFKLSDTDCEEEGECTVRSHGCASIDRLVEAIRRNPFSVVLIEEFDRTDAVPVTRIIKRAMEQGRMEDSYGREVGLGSVVFVLTTSWVPEELKKSLEPLIQYEEKFLCAGARRRRFRLELSTEKTPSKRCVDWQEDGDPPAKLRRLPLDLRLTLGPAAWTTPDEESSDATVESNVSKGRLAVGADEHSTTLSVAAEMMKLVDGVLMFQPVNFALKKQRQLARVAISKSFEATVGEKWSIRIDEEVIDHVVGAQWIAGNELEQWCEEVLTPLCKGLKGKLIAADIGAIVRLSCG